jgi:hypothetical protein
MAVPGLDPGISPGHLDSEKRGVTINRGHRHKVGDNMGGQSRVVQHFAHPSVPPLKLHRSRLDQCHEPAISEREVVVRDDLIGRQNGIVEGRMRIANQ